MKKQLSEMTMEELWQLFPIVLTEHNTQWNKQYRLMAEYLKEELSSKEVVRISHIGSTAVKSIWAKPIVDILVEIAAGEDIKEVSAIIVDSGFIKMSESPGRASFNRGYTPDGFANEVYHCHLRYAGDNDELYFRDYLNKYPNVASEYQKIKLELWKKYEHNRDAYTDAKTDFVRKYTSEAKKLFGELYC